MSLYKVNNGNNVYKEKPPLKRGGFSYQRNYLSLRVVETLLRSINCSGVSSGQSWAGETGLVARAERSSSCAWVRGLLRSISLRISINHHERLFVVMASAGNDIDDAILFIVNNSVGFIYASAPQAA